MELEARDTIVNKKVFIATYQLFLQTVLVNHKTQRANFSMGMGKMIRWGLQWTGVTNDD